MLIHVHDIDLYYEVIGEGRPLILLHGNGEDHTIFDDALKLLSEHFTCYVVDSRGHGMSSAVERLHYRDMAQDMIDFMEALDLQNVIFYGFSDGGIIGLMVAAACERVTDLIVSGANIDPKGLRSDVYLKMRWDYMRHKEDRIKMMLEEPDITTKELGRIKARTLVLAGAHDMIRRSHTKKIAAAIPGSRLRIIRDEGHGSYIVHSMKIAVLILLWFHLVKKGV